MEDALALLRPTHVGPLWTTWHRMIGGTPWAGDRAGAASAPGPAGDDGGRGRLCTTLRELQRHAYEQADGSHTVAHPLGQRVAAIVVARSSGIMATRCPHRPQPLRRIFSI